MRGERTGRQGTERGCMFYVFCPTQGGEATSTGGGGVRGALGPHSQNALALLPVPAALRHPALGASLPPPHPTPSPRRLSSPPLRLQGFLSRKPRLGDARPPPPHLHPRWEPLHYGAPQGPHFLLALQKLQPGSVPTTLPLPCPQTLKELFVLGFPSPGSAGQGLSATRSLASARCPGHVTHHTCRTGRVHSSLPQLPKPEIQLLVPRYLPFRLTEFPPGPPRLRC